MHWMNELFKDFQTNLQNNKLRLFFSLIYSFVITKNELKFELFQASSRINYVFYIEKIVRIMVIIHHQFVRFLQLSFFVWIRFRSIITSFSSRCIESSSHETSLRIFSLTIDSGTLTFNVRQK